MVRFGWKSGCRRGVPPNRLERIYGYTHLVDEVGENFGWAIALEVVPAALFGLAIGFAVVAMGDQIAIEFRAGACAVLAFFGAWKALRRFGSHTAGFSLPHFERTAPMEASCANETLDGSSLAPAEAASPPSASPPTPDGADELLLDDLLESLGPESRVIRLFQSDSIPTAGELQARIDRHIRCEPPQVPPPDATQALHDALAELRRSLR